MSGVGHNSGEPDDTLTVSDEQMEAANKAASDERLRLLIERIERQEEEKKGIADDIKDTYAEVKAVGYDAKMVRRIIALRKMTPDDRAEMDAILDTYLCALGMK